MQDYRVQLEAYAGPLDLLLYLVKRNEVDLHDIPVAELTEQYMRHLGLIQQIDVEKAGEFLLMAATLLEIKSQLLMPREEGEQADDESSTDATDEQDPRYELVQQLLAYKRYKDAARALEQKQTDWQSRFRVSAAPPEKQEDENARPIEIDLEDVNVLDLCEAFQRMLDSIGQIQEHHVSVDDTPIALHQEDIYDRLTREGSMTLQRMFEGRSNRAEMVGLFLATLELVREKRVRVYQEAVGGEIHLEALEASQEAAAEEAETDWRDPQTGEIAYDWPDEAARRRAERRARIRAAKAAKGQLPVDETDDEEEDELIDELDEYEQDAPADADDPAQEVDRPERNE